MHGAGQKCWQRWRTRRIDRHNCGVSSQNERTAAMMSSFVTPSLHICSLMIRVLNPIRNDEFPWVPSASCIFCGEEDGGVEKYSDTFMTYRVKNGYWDVRATEFNSCGQCRDDFFDLSVGMRRTTSPSMELERIRKRLCEDVPEATVGCQTEESTLTLFHDNWDSWQRWRKIDEQEPWMKISMRLDGF